MKKQRVKVSLDGFLAKILTMIMLTYILLAPEINWVRLVVFFVLMVVVSGIEAVDTGE